MGGQPHTEHGKARASQKKLEKVCIVDVKPETGRKNQEVSGTSTNRLRPASIHAMHYTDCKV